LQLQAHPTARGQWATGVIFISFSGMAVLSGAALTGVGCSLDGHSGMCTGGIITAGIGAAALAGSLWLFLDSRPRAELSPYTEGGNTLLALPARPGVRVTPTGLFGTF
jgi:hypothetical protein